MKEKRDKKKAKKQKRKEGVENLKKQGRERCEDRKVIRQWLLVRKGGVCMEENREGVG